MTEGYENLANAIIVQAVRDWRDSVRKLKKNPAHTDSLHMKAECERFFLSKWFTALTTVDGSWLLRKLKEEEGICEQGNL